MKRAGSGSRSVGLKYGSADPDPYQNAEVGIDTCESVECSIKNPTFNRKE